MSGKWTERGIECEHEPSHLVADKDGVVVCNKRKPREEVPIGKMLQEKTAYKKSIVIERQAQKPIGRQLLEKLSTPIGGFFLSPLFFRSTGLAEEDQDLWEACEELLHANGRLHAVQSDAQYRLDNLIKKFRATIYIKGLAVPNLEALHDKQFACPKHSDSRFIWQPQGKDSPQIFKRSCLECSLPPHFKEGVKGTEDIDEAEEQEELADSAYDCKHCGIVLGKYEVQDLESRLPENVKWTAAYGDRCIWCRLCGTQIGIIYGIQR